MKFSRVETLPDWIKPFLKAWPDKDFSTPEDRMRLVIALSKENHERETGGATGAAIFRIIGGKYELFQVAVNRAVSNVDPDLHDPTAHAEMMAYRLAAEEMGSHSLGLKGMPSAVLVTSAEPCGMCTNGAISAGIREIEIGARDEDMRKLGYNEGLKPANWVQQLNNIGIKVTRDILRGEADSVLKDYKVKVDQGRAQIHAGLDGLEPYHRGMEEGLMPKKVRPRLPKRSLVPTKVSGTPSTELEVEGAFI